MPSTQTPPRDLEFEQLEAAFAEEVEHQHELEDRTERLEARQTATWVLILLVVGFVFIAGIVIALAATTDDSTDRSGVTAPTATAPASDADPAAAANAAGDQGLPAGVKVEPYRRPDPTLPAVPADTVKKFRLDVFEHVTRVSKTLPPTRVWSFGVNGVLHRGTGVSTPMVVEQGDLVEITLVNGASKKMDVRFQHSIDYHSSEVAPNKAFKSIAPGETHVFKFRADHPGVFMYHCATQPVLMHTGAGMVGMMVVKPKNLAPVDRELWMTQQEFYVGQPGRDADMKKMEAKKPDAITFNGFANQYMEHPIAVKKGEKVRMYVLNAGPSIWSAFHVIGTVFDRTVVEGTVGRHAQTINLAPSQGGWVEFTLDAEGNFPFVTHAFGDMVTGALGVLRTEHAPKAAGGH
jgi:nitrite reductase (NO-forming)